MGDEHVTFLKIAIEQAYSSMRNGQGGPFGAVIVRDGEILAVAGNRVAEKKDPTAHAEMEAIRMAAEKIDHHRLDGATLYSSCEPCPMCLAAAYWARIRHIIYASDKHHAREIGRIDQSVFKEISLPPVERKTRMQYISLTEAKVLFEDWAKKDK